jgi:hypothetical protein
MSCDEPGSEFYILIFACRSRGGYHPLTVMILSAFDVCRFSLVACAILHQLNLERNRLAFLSGLQSLHNLRVLNVRGNSLTKMEGIECLSALEVLDMSQNHISVITHLDQCTRLTLVDLSHNAITSLVNMSSLSNLKARVVCHIARCVHPTPLCLTTPFLHPAPRAPITCSLWMQLSSWTFINSLFSHVCFCRVLLIAHAGASIGGQPDFQYFQHSTGHAPANLIGNAFISPQSIASHPRIDIPDKSGKFA